MASADDQRDAPDAVPALGPSPNPDTNLLIAEIVLGAVTFVSREAAARALLGKQYTQAFAKKAMKDRSTAHRVTRFAATRLAARSLPGLALVGTGLVAKTLFDRSQHKRKAKLQRAPRD